MFDLSGKRAVVTGGGSGIGEAIAKTLAEAGAQVFILDLDKAGAARVVEEIKQQDGFAEFLICNVVNQEEVIGAFRQLLENECLDILVNNAGIAHIGNVESTSEGELDKIYEVNVKGIYNCIKAGIPYMKEQGGSIINMSSIAALMGLTDRFAYSMSKGAVHAMTLSVAKDYLEYNIRCNSIAPGRVHTPFVDGFIEKNYPGKEAEMFEKLSKSQPIGRMGKPIEIAALVRYLCADEASFVTGVSYNIDGGFVSLNS
ncbi:MAG: SDR family oxidoreductase [Cyclobacteriaceae bacterium]